MDSRLRRSSETVEAEAAQWLARRESSTWTEADQAGLDAWIGERTEHRIAFVRLSAAWNHAARMKALGAAVPAGVIPPRGSWGPERFSSASSPDPNRCTDVKPRKPVWRARAIAVAACFLVAAMTLYVYRMVALSGDIYTTPVGGMSTIQLADGSRVTLNTNTRIRVRLTAAERRIELERGEAFFRVSRDQSRPFIVDAGARRVVAVGTQFEVRREHDDIEVIVTEGKVRLSSDAAASLSAQPPTYLAAGDIARALRNEVIIRTHAAGEAQKLLSWRTGYVIFDNTTLAEAVAEFNRYNSRKIVIADPAIASIRIGGHFRLSNTSGFLWLLSTGFPVDVTQGDGEVILKAR